MERPICNKCSDKPCEKSKSGFRKTCWNCRVKPEYQRLRLKNYRTKVKEEIVKQYGGECSCCGETILDFLAIDHINNDGNTFRKKMKTKGISFYLWIRRSNYPKDLQCLCFNCNWGKHVNNGVCPHKII